MTLHLDPRSKLYLLLIANFLLFFQVDLITEMIFTAFLCILLFTGNQKMTAIRFIVIYMIAVLIDQYLLPDSKNIFLMYISAIAVTIRMILPCIISGTYAFTSTGVSEFVSALRRMHISESIIIPVMVVIRFFPTIKEDYTEIKNAMALKGINHNNPVKKLEYVLIPLLMNTNNTAQDLTCAALSKGLSMPGKHTSMVTIRFQMIDVLVIVFSTLLIFLDIGGIL